MHPTLRVTRLFEVGLTDQVQSLQEVVNLIQD